MNIIIDLIKEYLLIFYNHTYSMLVHRPPHLWERGEKGSIIVIPGFAGTWQDMRTIGNHFNKKGYKILTLNLVDWPLHSIYTSSDELISFVKRNNLSNCIVIGHSKGGLVIRRAMAVPDFMKRIKTIITISTPHKGTIFGYLYTLYLNELKPGGALCKELERHKKYNSSIINIYPKFDNHVIPNSSLHLEGAQNIQLPIIGHTRILESKELLDIIEKYV